MSGGAVTETHWETISSELLECRSEAELFLKEWDHKAPADLKGNGVAAFMYYTYNIDVVLNTVFQKKLTGLPNAATSFGHKLGLSLMERAVAGIMRNLDEPFSYLELSERKEFRALADFTNGIMGGEAAVLTMLVMLYHFIAHENAGRRVYRVTDALSEKLVHTELRGLLCTDLRLPFENVYLQVPENARLRVYNSDSGWHRCVGIYITEDKGAQGEGFKKFLESQGRPIRREYSGRDWRFMAVGEARGFLQSELGGFAHDDALSYFRVPLPETFTVDEAVEATTQYMKDVGDRTDWVNMEDEWHRIFRWAMNAMLYATWTEPGEAWMANKDARQLWNRIQKTDKKSKKRSNLSRKFQKLDPQKRILLGKNVVVDRGITKSLSESREQGSSMVVRTRVSGHWRRQAHGTGRKLRKLIWIEPFWKGPVDGVISTPGHALR